MSVVEFNNEEKKIIIEKIQSYFREEMDEELGRFDAEFLLDFISEKIGVYFYNRGLKDAQAIVSSELEKITDAIYEKEKPTDF